MAKLTYLQLEKIHRTPTCRRNSRKNVNSRPNSRIYTSSQEINAGKTSLKSCIISKNFHFFDVFVFRIKVNLKRLGILFVLVAVVWAFTSLIPSQTPFKYNLSVSREHPHEVTTSRLGVKFYVSEDTLQGMQKNPK
jgi:hypothetical protein